MSICSGRPAGYLARQQILSDMLAFVEIVNNEQRYDMQQMLNNISDWSTNEESSSMNKVAAKHSADCSLPTVTLMRMEAKGFFHFACQSCLSIAEIVEILRTLNLSAQVPENLFAPKRTVTHKAQSTKVSLFLLSFEPLS